MTHYTHSCTQETIVVVVVAVDAGSDAAVVMYKQLAVAAEGYAHVRKYIWYTGVYVML